MAKKEATLILKIKEIGTEALDKTKAAIGGITKAAALASTAIVGFVGAGVAAFKTQESAVNKLNQAMVNNGDFSRKASDDLQQFASELQKVSTFGDEAIIDQLALAKAFGVSNEEAKKMVKAAADLSAATGMSLDSAVKNLGKTMAGMTGELGESVPALRNLTAEELKAGAAIDLVAEKFKGSTQAQIEGLGAVDQLKNSFGDFMELVGERAQPIIVLISKSLNDFVSNQSNVDSFLNSMTTGFVAITKTGSFVLSTIRGIGGVIGTVLAASIESVSMLTSGQFQKAKETVQLGMQEVSTIIEEESLAHQERMDALDEAVNQKNIQKKQRDLSLLQQSNQRKKQIDQKKAQEEITDLQKHQAKLLGLEIKDGETRQKLQERLDKATLESRSSTLSNIATLQNSSNKTLAAIGKAAALTQIAIDGPIAVTKALAAFPPPINFAAAAAVGLAVAAQAARVVGVQLAEGGIVQATPGGVPAIIGEGGRDEAVIPLDDANSPIGGNITLIVNGGLLGDESSAKQLAVAIDNELFKLRKSNESVAFDEALT